MRITIVEDVEPCDSHIVVRGGILLSPSTYRVRKPSVKKHLFVKFGRTELHLVTLDRPLR
jgi:hypothetical protein